MTTPQTKVYESMTALVRDTMPRGVQDRVAELLKESRIATRLAQLRHKADLTQSEMADKMGLTQSAISKLEAGNDVNITLSQIAQYSKFTGERINVFFGRPLTPMEAIGGHANALKHWLDAALEGANQQDPALQAQLKESLAETFLQLINIITECSHQLPTDADDNIQEFKVEINTGRCAGSRIPKEAAAA